jgi:hypothetical protein
VSLLLVQSAVAAAGRRELQSHDKGHCISARNVQLQLLPGREAEERSYLVYCCQIVCQDSIDGQYLVAGLRAPKKKSVS